MIVPSISSTLRSRQAMLLLRSSTTKRVIAVATSTTLRQQYGQQQQQQRQQVQVRCFSAAATAPFVRKSLAMGPQKRLEATALPQERTYESDLVVVLDMDECLIHSQFLSDHQSSYAHQIKPSHWKEDDENSVDTFDITLPDGDLVKVHERPHLHDFLDKVSDRFETHVFTAAMEVYAKPVLDTLDPFGTRFTKRWYRESCVQTKEGAFVKNLGVLQRNVARVVLVDNNPLSFLANPSNGILVSSFYNDAADKTLVAVLQLLHEIDGHEDVRPHLDKRFGLKTALEEITKNGLP